MANDKGKPMDFVDLENPNTLVKNTPAQVLGNLNRLAERTGLLFIIVLLCCLLSPWVCSPVLSFNSGVGVIVEAAQSLAAGHGYCIEFSSRPLIKFPPLFSAILSVVWTLFPHFPDNLCWMRLLNIGFLLGSACLLWHFLSTYLSSGLSSGPFSGLLRVALVLAVVGDPYLHWYTLSLQPETLYLFCVVLVFHGAQNYRPSRGPLSQWLIAAVLGALSFYARTAGIALIASLAVVMLIQRQYKAVFKFAVLCGLLCLPWWVFTHNHPVVNPLVGNPETGLIQLIPFNQSYLQEWSALIHSPAILVKTVMSNFTMLFLLGLGGLCRPLMEFLLTPGVMGASDFSLWAGAIWLIGSAWIYACLTLSAYFALNPDKSSSQTKSQQNAFLPVLLLVFLLANGLLCLTWWATLHLPRLTAVAMPAFWALLFIRLPVNLPSGFSGLAARCLRTSRPLILFLALAGHLVIWCQWHQAYGQYSNAFWFQTSPYNAKQQSQVSLARDYWLDYQAVFHFIENKVLPGEKIWSLNAEMLRLYTHRESVYYEFKHNIAGQRPSKGSQENFPDTPLILQSLRHLGVRYVLDREPKVYLPNQSTLFFPSAIEKAIQERPSRFRLCYQSPRQLLRIYELVD